MDANTKLNAKRPSRRVTEGPERAPHRSYSDAMELTTGPIHQPLVSMPSCCTTADQVPEGAIVKVAGMKELKFPSPARCFDAPHGSGAAEKSCYADI